MIFFNFFYMKWKTISLKFGQLFWKVRLRKIGRNTIIHQYVVMNGEDQIKIGSNVTINPFVHIWGSGGVEIGDDTVIATHVIITSLTHEKSSSLFRKSLIKKYIKIGNNVWIGSGAIIFPGVTIGDGSIIGAGAVVNKDIPPKSIAVGIPAKIISKINNIL